MQGKSETRKQTSINHMTNQERPQNLQYASAARGKAE